MNRFLTIAVIVMLAITTGALFATKDRAGGLPPDSSSGKAQVGGAFSLVGVDGNNVSDTDFRGKYMLVFFGFTRCPDICPLAMTTVTSAMQSLGAKADIIVPVFISVDVKHDTPAVIKSYLANFDARIVGLTGSEEQVRDVASAYKAFYSAEGDTVNHSSLLYLMNKDGEYIAHYPHDMAPDALAAALKEQVK